MPFLNSNQQPRCIPRRTRARARPSVRPEDPPICAQGPGGGRRGEKANPEHQTYQTGRNTGLPSTAWLEGGECDFSHGRLPLSDHGGTGKQVKGGLRFRRRGEAEGSHRSLGEAGSPAADGGYTISAWRGRAGEKGVPFGGIRARFICKEKEKKVSSDRDGRDEISIPSQSHHPIPSPRTPGPHNPTSRSPPPH